MAPRLSGQTSIFGVFIFVSKPPLGIEKQKKLEKFAILTRKPRSHVTILIYRTWPISPRKEVRKLTFRALALRRSESLRRLANARNVSFRISLRWPIHIINPVDKTKLSFC